MEISTHYVNERPMIKVNYNDGTFHVMTWDQWKEIKTYFKSKELKPEANE
ncbi:MAG: hypothetical protein PHC75_07960 [Burkholderiales bacterium]|jgi:hypothetical protein|nr:hypothetical protein [Burkholderiales bacterium]